MVLLHSDLRWNGSPSQTKDSSQSKFSKYKLADTQDLKCHNIFLTKNNIVKIGDLGVAKLLKFGVTKTTVGTPDYMCPEIWMKMPYDAKSDVWSLGKLWID